MRTLDSQIEDRSVFETGTRGKSRRRVLPWPVTLFLFSLVMPFFFQLGPMLLTVNRAVLLAMLVPCFVMWLRGRAGAIRVFDIALFLMCLWVAISFFVIHGTDVAVEAGGILFVETMGAFLMARCYIRDADSFRAMVRMLFRIIMLLLPFAVYETLTAHNILLEWANKIAYSGGDVWKEPRWGLDRVQGVFQHPILSGVFCGSILALTYYVLGYGVAGTIRRIRVTLIGIAAFLSLSSGPLTALIAQLSLILWDRLLTSVKSRWAILSGGVLSMIVAIEIAANRNTPEIFISYFAFNTHTASNRLRIWKYGSASVANHPLFGVGNNEWERPYWMSSSMDMFWLVPAVRNGLPTTLLLQLAFFSLFLAIVLKRDLNERVAHYRTGYLICLVGFYLTGWTVNYWKSIYTLFIFLLGSGAWILDSSRVEDPTEEVGPSGLVQRRRLGIALRRPLGPTRYARSAPAPKDRPDQ